MRRRLTVVLLLGAAVLAACAGAATARTNRAARARVFKQYVAAPAQFDLTLAEIIFGQPAHVAGAEASGSHRVSPIRLAMSGPTGLDYVAGAVTRFRVLGRPRLLVLVVNRRPRGSLAPDVARIGLTVTAAGRLGAATLLQIRNPFTRPATRLMPALCDLPIRGTSLSAGDLRSILSRGLPLTAALGGVAARFGAEAAVAQAYDAVCGRPYDAAFRQAVTQGSSTGCEAGRASVVRCCPPNAMCVPPPCPPCPCGPGPCPLSLARSGQAALACPLQSQPIACPL